MRIIILLCIFLVFSSCDNKTPDLPSVFQQKTMQYINRYILTTEEMGLNGKVKSILIYPIEAQSYLRSISNESNAGKGGDFDTLLIIEIPEVATIEAPENFSIYQFEFNKDGNIIKEIDGFTYDKRVTDYVYNNKAKIKEITSLSGGKLMHSKKYYYDLKNRIERMENINESSHYFTEFVYFPNQVIFEDYKIENSDTQFVERSFANLEGVSLEFLDSVLYKQNGKGDIIEQHQYDENGKLLKSEFRDFDGSQLLQTIEIDSSGFSFFDDGNNSIVRSMSMSRNGFKIVIDKYDSPDYLKRFIYEKFDGVFFQRILEFSYDLDEYDNWVTQYRGTVKVDSNIMQKRILKYY